MNHISISSVAQKTEQNAHTETVTNDKTVKKTQFLRDYLKKS